MISLHSIHHIAIICSDYEVSKRFYTEVLGFSIASEHYRKERKSWKLDLKLHNNYVLELFSFPDPPRRVSQPEACGLRHLAFAVDNLDEVIRELNEKGVVTEAVRKDAFTGRRFAFFTDPDGLPLELYEL